jgi:hypothetical protein
MKRGQSPVVPFFRGGEGDGTFNGFVLSNLEHRNLPNNDKSSVKTINMLQKTDFGN